MSPKELYEEGLRLKTLMQARRLQIVTANCQELGYWTSGEYRLLRVGAYITAMLILIQTSPPVTVVATAAAGLALEVRLTHAQKTSETSHQCLLNSARCDYNWLQSHNSILADTLKAAIEEDPTSLAK